MQSKYCYMYVPVVVFCIYIYMWWLREIQCIYKHSHEIQNSKSHSTYDKRVRKGLYVAHGFQPQRQMMLLWATCDSRKIIFYHAKKQAKMGLKSVSRKISWLINWSWQFHTMTMTFGVSPQKNIPRLEKKPGKMQVGTVDQPVSSNVADGKISHKWRFIAEKDMDLNGDVCS